MKYCKHCGKEIMDEAIICPGCGCKAENERVKVNKPTYDEAVSGAATTNIIAAVILMLGIFVALFINVWLGVVLCLVAEVVSLVPKSKVQGILKDSNRSLDKKEYRAKAKQCQKELKAKYSAYKFSFILAYIAFTCLIVFLVLGDMLGLI